MGSSVNCSCRPKVDQQVVSLSIPLDTLRTQASLGNTGCKPSRKRPRNASCGPPAQTSKTTRSRCSPEHCPIDPEISGQFWSNIEHVALHPRFSGQDDKLDEQCDQSTGWVPTDGCSTSKSRMIATSAAGTNASNECTNYAIPDRDQVQYLCAQLAHRDVQLEHVRSEQVTHVVQEKSYLHICVYSAAKLMTGNPEWSAKRKKY